MVKKKIGRDSVKKTFIGLVYIRVLLEVFNTNKVRKIIKKKKANVKCFFSVIC